ncbi:Stp1/IreP family PP2C-type Ser/Thr phosphatase [Bacillaceae bacterium S4-13-58]
MKGYFLTDQGQVRTHNEDAGGVYINSNEQLLVVVADGMGGHLAGDVASHMATSLLQSSWDEAPLINGSELAEQWLRERLIEINQKVYQHSLENDSCKGMGTTVVAAICTKDYFTVAHIGDSRCYLNNSYGFKQITEDHSLVNELVRSGQITKEDAEHHPRKNVLLKALGTEEEIRIDIKTLSWDPNDRLLLCSDGLTNKISDEELGEFVTSQDIKQAAENLVQLANDRGGEDNISLALIHYDHPKEEGDS